MRIVIIFYISFLPLCLSASESYVRSGRSHDINWSAMALKNNFEEQFERNSLLMIQSIAMRKFMQSEVTNAFIRFNNLPVSERALHKDDIQRLGLALERLKQIEERVNRHQSSLFYM